MIELLTAVIGVLAPALTYISVKWVKEKKKNEILKQKYRSSSLKIDLVHLNELGTIVQDIFENTKCDRFLLLTGLMRLSSFPKVSAVHELHNVGSNVQLSIGATSKYMEITVDSDYQKMLEELEIHQEYYFETEKEKGNLLANIYKDEGVTHSLILKNRIDHLSEETKKIIYSSFSSHSGGFDNSEKFRIRTANYKLNQILEQ